MKKENLTIGFEFKDKTIWGFVTYKITRVTNKCVFCTTTSYIKSENLYTINSKETRFEKDYLINTKNFK